MPRMQRRERYVVRGLKALLEAEGYNVPLIVWMPSC